MGLWVLEDKYLDHVPGTAPLAEISNHVIEKDEGNLQLPFPPTQLAGLVRSLKHSTGKDKDIILVPQPSDSPRDPLNWPLWKRDFMFLIFSSNSAVVGAWSFMLTPGYGLIAEEFGIVCPLISSSNQSPTIWSMDNWVGLISFWGSSVFLQTGLP
jgi:hypothetical protein